MDLLGDIGASDQLTAARSENAVLQEKCKQLSLRVKELTVENEALKAEVEMYRNEAALPGFSSLALGESKTQDPQHNVVAKADEFVRSGNDVYPKENEVTLYNLHLGNNLSCALSPDETILATGGADQKIALCAWGAVTSPETAEKAVKDACRLDCPGPVIALSFSPSLRNTFAAGCMDGSVCVGHYSTSTGSALQSSLLTATEKHTKYVRSLAWSPDRPLLATGSADGTIIVFEVTIDALSETDLVKVRKVESLHLEGAVEALCFTTEALICYARGTPYLSFFDGNFKQTKLNLNDASGNVTGGFSDHVSFAVMDIKPDPSGKYLALATDTSRNIIIDAKTGRQIRNLYGHSNDGFSQPKIAWSANGQYLLGNTQDEACICVWDIASTSLVKRLTGHTSPIRDLRVGAYDTLVTTSFDKTTRFWFPKESMEM